MHIDSKRIFVQRSKAKLLPPLQKSGVMSQNSPETLEQNDNNNKLELPPSNPYRTSVENLKESVNIQGLDIEGPLGRPRRSISERLVTSMSYENRKEHWIARRYNKCNVLGKLSMLYFGILILAGVGGVIFNLAEYNNEEKELVKWHQQHQNLTNYFNQTELEFIHGPWHNVSETYHVKNMWEFQYSAFFASTTFTTIGFGFQAPQTTAGRAFTFFWGLPAILTYGCLASTIGRILIAAVQTLFINYFKLDKDQWKQHRCKIYFIIITTLFFSLAYVIFATFTDDDGFGKNINSYGHAVYFLFQISSTIGFGDVMMSSKHVALSGLIAIWMGSFLGMGLEFFNFLNSEVEKSVVGISLYASEEEEVEL